MPDPITAMVAGAILEAAIGLATDISLGEPLGRFVSNKRQRKGFDAALDAAFAEFRSKYANLAASLFDERFVKESAAPELAKLLTPSQEPDPLLISAAYAKQFGSTPPDVSRAVEDLIDCVRRALANEPALNELWHRRQTSEMYELVQNAVPQIQEAVRQLSFAKASVPIRVEEERQSADALKHVLRLRTLPGFLAQREIATLARRVSDGDLARVSREAHARVLYWAARLHAADKATIELSCRYRDELLELEPDFDTSIIDAWLDFHRSGLDAGLQHVRDLDTPEGRSACFAILRSGKGGEAAFEWFESRRSIDDSFFTAVGWRVFAITMAEIGKWEEASRYLAMLTPLYVEECPDLAYVEGVINAALMLPSSVRHHALAMNVVDPQIELREGATVAPYRRRALVKFQEAIRRMTQLGQYERAEAAEFWHDWVMLTDPEHRHAAELRVKQAMSEGQQAAAYVSLAVAFHIDFDPTPLESYLTHRERTVGLSPKDLRAKLTLIRYKRSPTALIKFLEDERSGLLRSSLEPAGIAYLTIDALVRDGQAVRAEEVLIENRQYFDPADFDRLHDLVRLTLGNDVRSSLEARYRETRDYGDLKNLVNYLRSRSDWNALLPFLRELFDQERNSHNALLMAECLRRVQTDAQTLEFLEANQDLEESNLEQRSIRAWTLSRLGRIREAKAINDILLKSRGHENDNILDMNLALQSGDWERFPAIVERQWERRDQLSPKHLIHLASIAAETGPQRAQQLIELAVSKAPNDAQTLVDAGSLSILLGRDNPAFEWISKAANLSTDGTPIRMVDMKELVDQIPAHVAHSRKVNEAYTVGDIPIHLCASALRLPLSRVLIGSARRNEREADPRRWSVIPIRFGGRRRSDLGGIKRPAFDLTSLVVLADLGLLSDLSSCFDQILLPSTAMEALANEQRSVRFHQPSLIREARKIERLVQGGKIRVWSETTAPPRELIREVGDDLAELLEAARIRNGRVVRSTPIHKPGTFMEEVADLRSYQGSIISARQIASVLVNAGLIDRAAFLKADEFLSQVDRETLPSSDPKESEIIYLDDLAITYLQSAGLLEPLVESGRTVYIHSSTQSRINELIELEETQMAVLTVLTQVRTTLRDLLASEKAILLPFESRDEEEESRTIATEAPTLASLFATLGECDAVCIDDRFVGKHPYMTDRSGRSVLLFGIDDLLVHMEGTGRITQSNRLQSIHLLRKRGFALIPIEIDELEARLNDTQLKLRESVLRETAELRILRQTVARLRSLNLLRQPAETAYLDQLRLTCILAIRRMWKDDENTVELARAKSDWIYRSLMPNPLDWAHTIVDAQAVLAPESAMAMQLSLMLPPIGGTSEQERGYATWLEESVLSPLLPAYASVVHALASTASTNLVAWAEEWARDTT